MKLAELHEGAGKQRTADRVNEMRHTYRTMVFVDDLFDVYKHYTLFQLLASGYPLCYRRSRHFTSLCTALLTSIL